MDLEGYSFAVGFILGFTFATLLGFITGKIRGALQGMRAPDRPMVVPTTRTPRSVLLAAAAAFKDFVLWWFLMFILFIVSITLLYSIFIGDPLDLFL